jgi:phenylacetate-CoA ligase
MTTADRLGRDELLALQERKLASMFERLRETPFYASRLGSLERGGRAIDSLRTIEPVDKSQLLADTEGHPPFGSIATVRPEEIAVVHMTAGTSGRGQEMHALTWRDVEAAGYLSSFAFRWAGLRFGEPAVFNIGHSNSSGGNAMHRGIQAIGQTPVLVAHLGFAERLELLTRVNPVGMYGTPSAINGLFRTAQETGFDIAANLPRLRFLLTSAEPFPIEWGRRMEEAWGARLYEDYGATQSASAICAASCEKGAIVDGRRGTLHFFEWSFVFEILDPTSCEPVSPGEWGELYITTLDKDAAPLLRFRTRDRVLYHGSETCSCGRSLMSIESGSITRYDDLMKIKGQNIWPADMENALFSLAEVREFAGEVAIGPRGRDELYLRIALVPDYGEPSAPIEETIKSSFKSRFNVTPQVEFVRVESLPQWQTPERKSRRFTDTRLEGLTK